MFDIGGNKAPGPDGYSSVFLKAWPVVGEDVCKTVKEFFISGKLPGEMNATLITLVPKLKHPIKLSDYRLIACCNVVYKCISKIVTNRIKKSLQKLVNLNQSAFIEGRLIQDNILITQELLKGHGYFTSGRGLRQGNPMSPYLFTLVMEVFTLIMMKNTQNDPQFRYHKGCKELKITHFCFADDLLVLCNGDANSVRTVKRTLEEFSNVSGLIPSINKSTIFFGNVDSEKKQKIIAELPLDFGKLPVKYLGVPLVTKKLGAKECKQLVDKVKNKVEDWKNKYLSYAGRMQLIASVLASIHTYWVAVFILPKSVVKDINKVLKGFLWCKDMIWKALSGKMKVDNMPSSWSAIIDHYAKSPCNNSIWSVIRRIVLATAVYFVWKERNNRLFIGDSNKAEVVLKMIIKSIRNQMMGLKVRKTNVVLRSSIVRVLRQGRMLKHGCEAALEVLHADTEAQTKAELTKKLTKKLYTFYMSAGRKIFEHIDEFNKTVLDLAIIEVKFEDEDIALLLLISFPASYEHFVDTLLYGREALTLEDVMSILNSKEIKERSKSRGERLKCYIFQSEDHLKRNCQKNNRKKSTSYVKKDEQPSPSGSTYDDSEVMMVMSAQSLLDWIMDSGCSYHMTPKLDIVFDFLECDGGSVPLGDNRECKIRGIGKSDKVMVINGFKIVLSGIRRDNYVYSLDGHAMAGELNASVEEKDSPVQVESLGGKRYFLSIVDDYSMRVWVYILRFKHEAFGKFKEWKKLVENQTGRTVKKLRTDNGLEFCNREFQQLCTEKATCTAAYLINKSSSTTIEKKTPMEMWSGHPSDYDLLRIFGYVAYPYDKQGKLEPKAVKCVLLGYPVCVKGYRLYRLDDESPKILTSRNVFFNESVMYKDTLKNSSAGVDKSVEELQRAKDKNETFEVFRDESNMAAYAFVVAAEEDTHEPLTYQLLVKIVLNDMLIACKSKAEIGSTKSLLKKEFDMKEPGEAKKILGMEIVRDRSRKILRVSQSGWELNVLDGVHEARHSVSGFVDSDYAKDPDKGRSITVYTFLVQGCVVSWKATLQNVMALSTIETEYMALTKAVKEAIWLRGLLKELAVELNTVAG
nr:RNA-directed DNA polymerase, eukaryota, reverse transcriptase zinc-binding domain protein [Tanacetum cinerariifolium]